MNFTAIANAPTVHWDTNKTYSSAKQTPHQDAGYIGIQITEGPNAGKWRNVDDNGHVNDDRTHAGGGERFETGYGATVIARRNGVPFVFPVA